MENSPCHSGTAHFHRRKNARRLSPSDLRNNATRFTRFCKAATRKPTSRGKLASIPSTISRELVRDAGARGYRFKQAHEKATQRREEASDKPRKMTPDLVELIEEKLTQEQWSPDQISGRLAKDGVALISHERIYQHVWKDKKDGGTLYIHLRHSGKKYNRRKGKNSGRGLESEPRRTSISKPPILANNKKPHQETGSHYTIIGANPKGVVISGTSSEPPNTPSSPNCRTRTRTMFVQACARVAFAAR